MIAQAIIIIFHQFLCESRWGPVVGDGVEGGVFAGDHGVGDDHAVAFVDAETRRHPSLWRSGARSASWPAAGPS